MSDVFTVRIFGRDTVVQRFDRGPGFVARVYVDPLSEAEEPPLNWNQIPEELMTEGGMPFVVNIVNDDVGFWRRCLTVADLKDYAWKRLNPNAAAVRDLKEALLYYRTRFREAGMGEFRDRRILEFQTDVRRNQLSSARIGLLDGCRVVYVPKRTRSGQDIKVNVPYVCSFLRVCVNNPPTANRDGFRLVEVQVLHEHFDPDARIAGLQAKIAAGHP